MINSNKLMLSCSGDLIKLSDFSVLREKYSFTFSRIKNRQQLRATIRNGKNANGYPLYLIFGGGSPCCFDCAKKEYARIAQDMKEGFDSSFCIVACGVNYEDDEMYCQNCSTKSPCAYGGLL